MLLKIIWLYLYLERLCNIVAYKRFETNQKMDYNEVMPIKIIYAVWAIPNLNYDQKIPKDFKVVKLEISLMNVLSNVLSNTVITKKWCPKSLIFFFSIFAKVGHIFKINHFKAMNSVHGLSKNTLTLSITCLQKLTLKVCKRVCCARHKPQGVIQ